MRGAYAIAGASAGALATLRSLSSSGPTTERLRERRGLWEGHAADPRPWVWIHAASVGEAEISTALAQAMLLRTEGVRFVLSAMTPTGRSRIEREPGVVPRYFPIDFGPFVKRVLEPLPPLLFVAVETEIWPTTLGQLARRGIPAAVVNARLSDSSLPRYRRLRPLIAPLVGGLAKVCARDADAADRWRSIGASEAAVEVTGNIKFDLAMPRDHDEIEDLFEPVERSPLLLAASTHEGEEAVALDAFRGTRSRFPRARLVLAPRHPARAAGAVRLASARGLKVLSLSDAYTAARAVLGTPGFKTRASGTIDWPPGIDVVVLDRLGLLRSAYAAADAAFVGGSLAPGPGGHNLLEAVALGCPPAAGPHLGNVGDQAQVLREAGALRVVSDVGDLWRYWTEVAENPRDFGKRLLTARAAIADRCGALQRSVDALLPLLGEPR